MVVRKLDFEKHAMWRERLEALKDSGLSLPEFCRVHGFNLHTVRFWQTNILKSNEFASGDLSEISNSTKRAKPKPRMRKPKRVNFAQVSVTDSSQIQVVAQERGTQTFRVLNVEIATPKGFSIRVAVAADAESLAMLIRATEQALC